MHKGLFKSNLESHVLVYASTINFQLDGFAHQGIHTAFKNEHFQQVLQPWWAEIIEINV